MSKKIGIDAGSKTIKVIVVNEEGETVHSIYRRHRSNIKLTLAEVLHELTWRFGDIVGTVGITGSAGIDVSEMLGLPFVQEVIATTRAVQYSYPHADVVIELGGEDAKLIYLTGGLEQRMNATCAGGTGGFVDTIAFMLGTKTSEISRLALGVKRIYPIASRCVVFAQTDIRPLLNRGAQAADIAASALEAVVRQTLGGLACGRPIEGTVIFLGGPMEYIPELVSRFRSALHLSLPKGIKPIDAHLFTARGAAFFGADVMGEDGACLPSVSLLDIERKLLALPEMRNDIDRLPSLFESKEDHAAFRDRHRVNKMPRARLFDCKGSLFLGIDAGSTAVKIAVLDEEGNLAYSDYRHTGGEVLQTTIDMLKSFYAAIPRATNGTPYAFVSQAVACGYGEDLLIAGLGIDSGVAETLAHVRAAQRFQPKATFLLDIGGQDIKAVWVRGGRVVHAVLNESCSSGCGSFVEGTANSLHSTLQQFSDEAIFAKSPVDLGTKCTVFMISRVRHAQKTGVSVSDIAAGVAYSVVRNALFRIIGVDNMDSLGQYVVVQGGGFMSDAVLRAFELVGQIEAIRPDTAHLMGAVGAALVAQDRALSVRKKKTDKVCSGLLDQDELKSLSVSRSNVQCSGCGNNCLLSLIDFGKGRLFVSGNRCNRAHGIVGSNLQGTTRSVVRPPNVVALEQKLLSRFSSMRCAGLRSQVWMGIMNTLTLYDQMPFWHTLFRTLEFSIAVPDDRRMEESGVVRESATTVPSESVCYPAKLTHARLFDLILNARVDAVFIPRYVRGRRCPVVCKYAEALADCVPAVREGKISLVSPLLCNMKISSVVRNSDDCAILLKSINNVALGAGAPLVTPAEFETAIVRALEAQEIFEETAERANKRALLWVQQQKKMGVVVGGRSYHNDPALIHGIDGVLISLGVAVLSSRVAKIPSTGPRKRDNDYWGSESHLASLAHFAAANSAIKLVCLQSFGCGYDAVNMPYAGEILERAGEIFTALKIDGMVDTAHIRIRLRTLVETYEWESIGSEIDPASLRESLDCDSSLEEVHDARGVQPFDSIRKVDIDLALRAFPDGICFVAKALIGRALRAGSDAQNLAGIILPQVCNKCVLDAIPDIVSRAIRRSFDILWTRSWCRPSQSFTSQYCCSTIRPRIGLIGNALLVFDSFINNGIVDLIENEGCEAVFPCPDALFVEDVRYISELDRFAEKGVEHVIYLQAFGCLKGHIYSRGALYGIAKQYPNMHLTVIDCDSEASVLNQQNRILLAIAAAKQSFS